MRKPLLSYYLRHLARIKNNNKLINSSNNKLIKFEEKEEELINKKSNNNLTINSSSSSSQLPQYNKIKTINLDSLKKPRLYSDGSLINEENINLNLNKQIIIKKEEETIPEEEEFQKVIEKEIEEFERKKEENNKEKQPLIAAAAVLTLKEEEKEEEGKTNIPLNEENIIEFEDDQQNNPFIGGDEINNYVTLLPKNPSPQEINYSPIISDNLFIPQLLPNQQLIEEKEDCSSSSSCQLNNNECNNNKCNNNNNILLLDDNNNIPSLSNVKLSSCGYCSSCSVCQCLNLPDPCNGPNCGNCPSICNCPEECGCNNNNNNNNYQQEYNQWYKQYGQQQYSNQYYQGGSIGGAFTTLQCFSSDQLVITPRGEIRMDKLKIGDMVLSIEESLIAYSPVIMFLHRLPNEKAKFRLIITEEGNKLKLTQFHLVWAGCNNLKLIRAKDLKKGECLYNVKNNNIINNNNKSSKEIMRLSSTKIKEIFEIEDKGIYAPLTANGNLIVNGLLASCHSNIAAQTLQQTFFRCWHFIYKLFNSDNKNNLKNKILEEERQLPFGVKFITSILDILLPKTFLPI